jgi:hypothetical protein
MAEGFEVREVLSSCWRNSKRGIVAVWNGLDRSRRGEGEGRRKREGRGAIEQSTTY